MNLSKKFMAIYHVDPPRDFGFYNRQTVKEIAPSQPFTGKKERKRKGGKKFCSLIMHAKKRIWCHGSENRNSM